MTDKDLYSQKSIAEKYKGKPEDKYLYDQKETADLFGVHVSTIWRWRKAGVIGAKKIGGKVLFTLDEINRVLKENDELPYA